VCVLGWLGVTFGPDHDQRPAVNCDYACALHASGADEIVERVVVEQILSSTSSGGVTVNAWASHAFEFGLPFGGIGNSGNGHYRGVHGFRELSHARSAVRMALQRRATTPAPATAEVVP
jgi:hypothetical protein